MATSSATSGAAKADDGVKFTITVQCNIGGEKRAVSYTVFKRTLMSQVFDSSVQFFKLDPSQVILVVKNKVALTHKCVEDYRLSDKSVLDLIHLKEAPSIELTLRDQAANTKTLSASIYHPLSDVVKAFCKHQGEETGFSDLYHGGIALDLDASPGSIGLKAGEQLFCYCYKAACKQYWASVGKSEQAKSLRFIKFYFSDWQYGYKTFPIFRHDISTPMEVLIKTFCAWRGLDYEQTGFLYSYTYKQVAQGDTATSKALADGDTILAYSRQELQGRLWDAILAGSCSRVLDLLDQGAELSTSIGPDEWGKHPLHAAVANGHVDLVKLLLQGQSSGGVSATERAERQLALVQGCNGGGHTTGAAGRSGGEGSKPGRSGKAGEGEHAGDAGPEACVVRRDSMQHQGGREGGEDPSANTSSTGPGDGGNCSCSAPSPTSGASPTRSPSRNVGSASCSPPRRGGGLSPGGASSCSPVDPGGGCDPNQLDYASDPPLWHAVENNLVELVEVLLAAGAAAADIPPREGRHKDASSPSSSTGYSACPHAARKGHAETLQVLLAAGANPWQPDADGYTAYDYALDHAKPPAVVAALLEGDPRFGEVQRSFQAAYTRMCQMLKRTQRYPALGCPCRTCNSLLEIRAPETEASRLVREQIGCVALVRAVQAGGPHCIEVMELLLKYGALLDGQDYDGRTALHQAIRYNRLAEAAWLTSKGAHLDIPDFEGLLPLHQAGCSGFCDITRLLVNAGAPLNLHTIKYVSQEALDAQARKQAEGHGGSKKAKRKQQLDVSGLTTIGGNSPLALAIRHGHGAIVEYLLSQNAVFDLKNAADSSAFHAALDKGSAAIAALLLQHINKKTGAGGGGGGTSNKSPTGGGRSLVADKHRGEKDRDGGRAGKKAAREREKEAREQREKDKEGSGSGSGGSDGGGGTEGVSAAAAAAPPSEPPVAFDAGAGLREMVLRERERLRQQMGLSTSSGGTGSSSTAVQAEPKPMLSIFARNGSSGSAAPRPAPAATAKPVTSSSSTASATLQPTASPPPIQPPANGSGSAAAAGGSGTLPGPAATVPAAAAAGDGPDGSCISACGSATSTSTSGSSSSGSASGESVSSATPASSTSASPKVITEDTGTPKQQQLGSQGGDGSRSKQPVQTGPQSLGQGGAACRAQAGAAESACVVASTAKLVTGTAKPESKPTAKERSAQQAGATSASQLEQQRGQFASAGTAVPPAGPPSISTVKQQQGSLTSADAAGSGVSAVLPQPTSNPHAASPFTQPNGPKHLAATAAAGDVGRPVVTSPPAPSSLKAAAAEGPAATAPGATLGIGKGAASGKEQPKPHNKGGGGPATRGHAATADSAGKAPNGTIPSTAGSVSAASANAGAVTSAAVMASPIKVKFRAKPVEPPAATSEPPPSAGPNAEHPSASAGASIPASTPPPPPQSKPRRGKVVTVPAAGALNRNRNHAAVAEPGSQSSAGGPPDGPGTASESTAHASYLTVPASVMLGSGAARHGSGAATRGAGISANVTCSALRPAAPSYSPRNVPSQAVPSTVAPQPPRPPTPSDIGLQSNTLQPHTPQPQHPSVPSLPPYPHHPHLPLHLQPPGTTLSALPLAPPSGADAPVAPPPPPGFGPRPPVGQPPSGPPAATAGLSPALSHSLPSLIPGDGCLSDLDRHLESSLESMVLSVVDQGMEESLGVGTLSDRLRLSSGPDSTSGLPPPGHHHTQPSSLAHAHSHPQSHHRRSGTGLGPSGAGGQQPNGMWPTPAEVAAALLQPGGGRGGGGPGELGGLHHNRHGLQSSDGVQPGGLANAATAVAGLVRGRGMGSVGDGPGPVGAGTVGAHMGYLGVLGRSHSPKPGAGLGELLECSSCVVAGAGGEGGDGCSPGDSGGGAADVALAAAETILDGENADGSGGGGNRMSRAASHQGLTRYDSGALQPSHGTSLALFSDVWANADAAAGAKGPGGSGMDAGAVEWRSGVGSGAVGGGQSDSWVVLAEAQQLQLSQAMGALAGGAHMSVPFGGTSGLPDMPPVQLEPLPEFPASLFDDDEGDAQRQPHPHQHAPHYHHSSHDSLLAGGSARGASGVGPFEHESTHGQLPSVGSAGSRGGLAGTPAGLGVASNRSGSGNGFVSAPASGAEPSLPQPHGARPVLFSGPNGMGGGAPGSMGPMGGGSQLPYGHPPGMMYGLPPMGPHPGPGFGGGYGGGATGPYADWYGAAATGPFGGFRGPSPPMMMAQGGGVYGNPAAGAAGLPGTRVGPLGPPGMGPPLNSGTAATGAAQGSHAAASQTHTMHTGQPAAASSGAGGGSAWFSGGGGKAVAMNVPSGQSRASGGGPDAASTSAGAGNSSSGGGGSSGVGGGGGNAGRHGHGRSKGRR